VRLARGARCPKRQRDDHRPERAAEVGQNVFVARWVRLVLPAFEQSVRDESLEAAREETRGDTEVGLELVEAGVTVEAVVQDEQGPPLADQAERRRERALAVFEPDPLRHSLSSSRSDCCFQSQ